LVWRISERSITTSTVCADNAIENRSQIFYGVEMSAALLEQNKSLDKPKLKR
jgi:hypothetical protein